MKTRYCAFILLLLCSDWLLAQTVDVRHLSLTLAFDWSKKQALGTAEITLALTNTTNKIYLDAGLLTINTISLNEKALQFNYDGSDKKDGLEVVLEKKYAAGEVITLKMNYHTNYENKADPHAIGGSFGKGLRFFLPTSTTPTKHKQIWSNGEPDHNKYWFPCHEDIADIYTTEIIATVEKPLMVISNGSLVDIIENDAHSRTYHYKSARLFPGYLISVVVGEYADIVRNANQIPIHNYGYPEEKEAVAATTVLLPDMMQFIEEKTGYNYPFSQYSQVVVQDYPFPGLIGQHTVATMSDNYIDDHGVHEDFKYLWDGVAVQALASQWFGNLIMPAKWDDIWLNNAFAQYFAGLYTAKSNSPYEYLLWYLPFEKGAVLADWEANYRHPIVTDKFPDLAGFTSDNYSKFRGALVLRMLQKEVGEENWWKSIQRYVITNANRQVTTKDFQRAIESTTGASFQWFFDQWIYKTGLPKFEITKDYDELKKQLIINVLQTASRDSSSEYEQVDFFKGKVEIEIDDTVHQVSIAPKAENTFIFSLPQAPGLVNFDYEETWICETIFEKSKEEYLQQLTYSKDVLAKKAALDRLVEIAQDPATTPVYKETILTAFKHEIASPLYWRYRLYALGSLRKILPAPYDSSTISLLLQLINTEKSWLKTSAIFTLGNTKEAQYKDVYIDALNDESDRVINAAAVALGKTKSPEAFEILINLEKKPSWKSQSRISALNGLEQLGDVRAVDFVLRCLADNQSPRWYLATPVWDYPYAAAYTLVTLGKADLGFPILFDRFKKSLQDNDLNDIFQNVQLIDILKDERAKEMYALLREKFKHEVTVLEVVKNYEQQFLESLKRKQ